MSSATEPQDQLRRQANDLYWNSGDTVDQLAARLGMSRKAVYSAVEPFETAARCADCGDPLVFTNRTRRASGLVNCTQCETEVHLEEHHDTVSTTPADLVSDSGRVKVHEVPGPQGGWEQIKEDLSNVSPERAAKIGGAAALGVALGAAAVKALKNRK
jgi:hypothetical protein